MTLKFNLLNEPLIRIRAVSGGQALSYSLPGLFVALVGDEVRDFPALRPHQRHPWHAFLVQLAAMALHHAGTDKPFDTEQGWKDALLGLTPAHPDGAAWCVITPCDRPAFMQAPVPSGNVDGWRNDRPTPDTLDDVLVTSKNHDLKRARIGSAQVDDWVFALVSLQTQAPYPGGGGKIYGVARMNGGASSRPGLGILAPGGVGNRWLRDVSIALSNRQKIVAEYGYSESGGIGLLWLPPWSGTDVEALSFSALDPFFIEICRRVRLVQSGARIAAMRTGGKMRILKAQADSRHGVTGDLWTPIDLRDFDKPKSLGMSGLGFSYKKIGPLAFGAEYRRPPAQCIQSSDPKAGLVLLARAIAGGQNKTAGYHERRIPIPPKMRMLLEEGIDQLAAISKERIIGIEGVSKVLEKAFEKLFDCGRQRDNSWKAPPGLREKVTKYLKSFELEEDARFFHDLNAEIESTEPDNERLQWLLTMTERATEVLENAFDAGPQSCEQRYRARSAALRRFHAGLRNSNNLPVLAHYFRQQSADKEPSRDQR